MTTKQGKEFKAEVSQVLDLVINSLYSNKDIFLRELISNSSDALDKLRFESLSNKDLIDDNTELQVLVSSDSEARTVTILDNGIGMSEEDLENNLGTIAKSGTKEFMQALKESKDSGDTNLIGQFGVGFYSAFIVAKKVTVYTKKAGQEKAFKWESEAKEGYSIEETHEFTNKSGTKIVLELKENLEDGENSENFDSFATEWKLSSIIKQYSDFVEYPIKLKVKNSEANDETPEGEKFLWETINSQKAIWSKDKSEISEEEYKDFYKHLGHDFNDPADWIHYKAEGTMEFTALAYLPQKAPMDLFMPENKKGLNLYINRVFITNESELLLPQYLRFIKGVVDSADLPLNVSREILQDNPRVKAIKKNLTKKVLSKFKDMMKQDRDKYTDLFKEFGKVIKEGVHVDHANKDKILELCLFESTKTEAGEFTSLEEYIERADSEQKEIYFLAGESRAELESSPYIEALRAKGIEVLFMTDAIDEWVTMSGGQFKEKSFKSAAKGDLEADEKTKEEIKKQEEESKDLLELLKEELKDDVADVKFSDRLVDTLACLVADEMGMSANMERIYQNANLAGGMPAAKRTLEINPKHALVAKMRVMLESNSQDDVKEYAELIHDQALLLEGSKVKDLNKFTQLMNKLMLK